MCQRASLIYVGGTNRSPTALFPRHEKLWPCVTRPTALDSTAFAKFLWMIDPQAPRSAQALDQQPAVIAALHLEIGHRLDEVGEAGEPVITGGEARYRLGALAELGQRRIALLVAF